MKNKINIIKLLFLLIISIGFSCVSNQNITKKEKNNIRKLDSIIDESKLMLEIDYKEDIDYKEYFLL